MHYFICDTMAEALELEHLINEQGFIYTSIEPWGAGQWIVHLEDLKK